ncbi:MAG: SH3 domain-containing protein [Syntrophobacterales bacterium]|nr:SH3 domain-containing protein [Syntrophobacterales bacterium]
MMKKWIYPFLVVEFLMPFFALARQPVEPLHVGPRSSVKEAAPSPLPHVRPEFEDVSYWIGRLRHPDRVRMGAEDIEKVNLAALKNDPDFLDILSLSCEIDTDVLKRRLTSSWDRYGGSRLYDMASRPLSTAYLARLFSLMNTEGVPDRVRPLYGIVVHATNLRVFPTDDLVMDRPFDYAFDRFQAGRLDVGTVVVILHYAVDLTWCFVDTGYSWGWVRPNDVAVGGKDQIVKFAGEKPLIVSGDSVSFYYDNDFWQYAFELPMGAKLPLAGSIHGGYRVVMPCRDGDGRLLLRDGFVRADADVHEGYLPYTIGAVLRQAFKVKDGYYSWGGLSEGRDCSRFIMDVFRCFGFRMPRDSYRQALFYTKNRVELEGLSDYAKIEALVRLEQTPTILYMPGHVMLFLGVVDNRAYAIHSFWEYDDDGRGVTYQVGRTVVSDLSLGKGGKGALLKWLTAAIPIN